ncbi:hypothetical protein GCM10027047_01380 [Rhodococcus aerolatus]
MAVTYVVLSGCDDQTHLAIEASDAERAFLGRLAAASTAASSYGCMPTLRVTPTNDDPFADDLTEETR